MTMDFDWDDGNRNKNLRHGVRDWEIEEAFRDRQKKARGKIWVGDEERFVLLGRCLGSGKYLCIVYTIRVKDHRRLVRPISVRDMSETERRWYHRKG